MTDPERIDAARETLPAWTTDHRDNYDAVVDVTKAPFGDAERDPITVIPYLQRYVDQMPLAEFEESDWVTLQNDIVSFLARLEAVQRHATWQVREAPNTPRGYRYVLVAADASDTVHFVDPYEVVAIEFQQPEIDVVRMIATIEETLAAPDTAW
ncbi:hypothetical protein [Winogradskya humida]|uniref:SMI1/KNR4 family protein SUKH-1 n=1 Tax=Winogradskya humida TaxID=113566 RepID=A0ABQ4A897_9ACTN|nr:hypothetical protein [Actinoplanes humidus]GIE26858.1 hypothetical protein Ahu01nite_099600 [Actinoplanes humidus]